MVCGGADFGFHLGGFDHFLAVEMAASFGGDLVFEMDASEASAFHFDDGSGDVPDVSESGVSVADDGDGGDLAGSGGGGRHFFRSDDGDVGESSEVIGDGSSAEVDRLGTLFMSGESGECTERSGHDDDLVLPEVAELFSGGLEGRVEHGWEVTLTKIRILIQRHWGKYE